MALPRPSLLLQAAQSTAPAPPSPPAPPAPVRIQGGDGTIYTMPTTADEVSALRLQRRELSNQLSSATSRREDLAEELKSADAGARAGIEARIAVLDERIVQIERDIAATGQLLAQTPGNLLATAQTPSPLGGFQMSPDITAISVVFTIFVLTPLAIAAARLLWKRATSPKPQPTFDRENHERLQRLEQAVDSIAIEVERISEGQRFVTKLLADSRDRAAIGAPRE